MRKHHIIKIGFRGVDGALSFRVKSKQYFIPITANIDVAAEIEKLITELIYTKGFLK